MSLSPRPGFAAACAASLLLLVLAGCDKDKNVEPPAELVDLKPSLDVDKLWSASVGDDAAKLRLSLGLALDGGTLYAAARDGKVEAFDPASGKTKWSTDLKADLSAGPAVGGGRVAVGTSDGQVIALDTAGKQLWKATVNGEVLAAPLVTADRVIVRTVDGRLRSLDATNGKEQWSAEEPVPRLSLRGTAPPVLAGESVLAGFDSGKVMAFALGSGDVLWQSQVSTPRGRSELERLADVDSAVHAEGGDGYAVGYQGRVVMFALETGQVWWGRDLSSYRGLALDTDQLYVATSDGSVVALRRRDGTVLWQQDGLKRRGLSAPAVVGNAVVVGDFEGYLHWLDRDTGKFVAREHPGDERISAMPVVADNRVYVIDEGSRLVAYRSGGTPGR
jgi:outer membrane protein assembly factor BamB